jgi:hypothetical protein
MTTCVHLTRYTVNFDSNSYSLLRKYQFRLSIMFRSTTGKLNGMKLIDIISNRNSIDSYTE